MWGGGDDLKKKKKRQTAADPATSSSSPYMQRWNIDTRVVSNVYVPISARHYMRVCEQAADCRRSDGPCTAASLRQISPHSN